VLADHWDHTISQRILIVMKHLRFVMAFVILSFAIRPSAFAHPADQSEMRLRPSPHALEIRLTFNILTLTRFVPIDTDGDAVGAVFARSALGHAMRGGIAMEATRQSQNRATDVTLTAVAGAQILQASHGVKIIGDAAL
jgi:hypothetical protein